MTFKPGQSGNPNGRPTNERALTKLIENQLAKTIEIGEGDKKAARKRVMADILVQAVTTGKIKFPDGSEMNLEAKEVLDAIYKIINIVDGPPKNETDVNVNGQVTVVWDVPIPVPKSE